jgi:hypothetical protein
MTVRWAVIVVTDAGEEEVSDIKQMEEGHEPDLDETAEATAEEVEAGVEIGMIRGGPVGAVGGFGWREGDRRAYVDETEPVEPEPELTITSPEEGATVPAVHDIIGIGAGAAADVELWSDPELSAPNATTVADAEGNWGFTGDTPATLGDVTWTVRSGGSEASVNIHVVDAPARGGNRKTLKRKE